MCRDWKKHAIFKSFSILAPDPTLSFVIIFNILPLLAIQKKKFASFGKKKKN